MEILFDDYKRKIVLTDSRTIIKTNKKSYYGYLTSYVTLNEVKSLKKLEAIYQTPNFLKQYDDSTFEMSFCPGEPINKKNFFGIEPLEDLISSINSMGVFDLDLRDLDILVYEGEYFLLDFGASVRTNSDFFSQIYKKYLLKPKFERISSRYS